MDVVNTALLLSLGAFFGSLVTMIWYRLHYTRLMRAIDRRTRQTVLDTIRNT